MHFTARSAVVRRGQTSSMTPLILSEVMTDAPGSGVPLRFESAASLCEFKQPRGGPHLNFGEIFPNGNLACDWAALHGRVRRHQLALRGRPEGASLPLSAL